MPITFTKVPAATLDAGTGKASGIPGKKPLPNIGIPTPEFHKQVMDLAAKKVPIEKVSEAIDAHPQITDKPRAKSMAQAVYQIVGKQSPPKTLADMIPTEKK